MMQINLVSSLVWQLKQDFKRAYVNQLGSHSYFYKPAQNMRTDPRAEWPVQCHISL